MNPAAATPSSSGHCRVCGLRSADAPWGEDGASPSFTMCVCCGVEHGYGDFTPPAARRWRQRWTDGGCRWDVESCRPEHWNLEAQLADIPEPFR